jgi:hypothetical protein
MRSVGTICLLATINRMFYVIVMCGAFVAFAVCGGGYGVRLER